LIQNGRLLTALNTTAPTNLKEHGNWGPWKTHRKAHRQWEADLCPKPKIIKQQNSYRIHLQICTSRGIRPSTSPAMGLGLLKPSPHGESQCLTTMVLNEQSAEENWGLLRISRTIPCCAVGRNKSSKLPRSAHNHHPWCPWSPHCCWWKPHWSISNHRWTLWRPVREEQVPTWEDLLGPSGSPKMSQGMDAMRQWTATPILPEFGQHLDNNLHLVLNYRL
jgi:hypothetical protein